MSKQRAQKLDLYRLYAKDEAFKTAFFDTMKRMS
jgi:type I restriction enzyme R subunit